MPLAAGERLGPYEIQALIGTGGMGEVYKARDTRLDRTVAVKVLPQDVANNPVFRERFEREARAVSALNHPHICTLHDIGRQDGLEFLVMELLTGESLADRLEKGPIPVSESIQYAIEIADALDAAHRKGILHRDLKPPNIFLTPNGAKLLDFGLAKVQDLPTNVDDRSLGGGLTQKGILLGTPKYLAPEQFQGAEADARSDIFSFGAVLYEMLTGKRAFEGKTGASVMAAVLHLDPPDVSSYHLAEVSPALEHVIQICLAKDPNDRFQRVRDVFRELQWLVEVPSARAGAPPATSGKGGRRPYVYWGTIAILLGTILGLASAYFRRLSPQAPVLRLALLLPAKTQASTFALSPDGRTLALAVTSERGRQLWLRALDSLQAQQLPGTEDAQYPFWSPDSRYIAFFAQGKLKRIAKAGGPAQTICAALEGRGGTWNRDDIILFAPAATAGLHRVSAAGGTPAQVTKPEGGAIHRYPVFLADGRRFLYLVSTAPAAKTGIYLASLDSSENRRVIEDDANPAFVGPNPESPGGYLLFARQDTLMAQPLDARSGQPQGDPFAVAEQVAANTPHVNYSEYAVSSNGVLVFQSGGGGFENELEWFDRNGKELADLGTGADFAIAPDQKRVIIGRRNLSANSADLWMHDLQRGAETRFTFHPSVNRWPVWSPDGTQIVFRSNRNGVGDFYQKPANGTGEEQIFLHSGEAKYPYDWSLDGRFFIYASQDPKTRYDLWAMPLTGQRSPVPLLKSEFEESMGQVSPDGRWLAYVSDETGREEVYVQPFAAGTTTQQSPAGKWPISNSGGREPRWRRDGRELFYLAADRKLMAVEVGTGSAGFAGGNPRALFTLPISLISPGDLAYHYQPSSDGSRFLVASVPEGAMPPLTVVLNWIAEIRRNVVK